MRGCVSFVGTGGACPARIWKAGGSNPGGGEVDKISNMSITYSAIKLIKTSYLAVSVNKTKLVCELLKSSYTTFQLFWKILAFYKFRNTFQKIFWLQVCSKFFRKSDFKSE